MKKANIDETEHYDLNASTSNDQDQSKPCIIRVKKKNAKKREKHQLNDMLDAAITGSLSLKNQDNSVMAFDSPVVHSRMPPKNPYLKSIQAIAKFKN